MTNIPLPSDLYVLRISGTENEIVVHREGNEDYPYTFETEADAREFCEWATKIYHDSGTKHLSLVIEAWPLAKLSAYRVVRYKPADAAYTEDVPLPQD